jgi:hypothetical protein
VTRGVGVSHNEKLNYLHFSANIVWLIKSGRMTWTGNVPCIGGRRGIYRVVVVKPEGKRKFGDPGINGRMILR